MENEEKNAYLQSCRDAEFGDLAYRYTKRELARVLDDIQPQDSPFWELCSFYLRGVGMKVLNHENLTAEDIETRQMMCSIFPKIPDLKLETLRRWMAVYDQYWGHDYESISEEDDQCFVRGNLLLNVYKGCLEDVENKISTTV